MTNNEILRASLLDIIFENRNKAYGAYALRREYNQRLLVALGAGLSLIFLFVLMITVKKRDAFTAVNDIPEVIIRPYEVVPEKPKEPEKQRSKPAQQIATQKFINAIEIKPDHTVISTIPAFTELEFAMASDQTREGKKPDGIPQAENKVPGNGSDTAIAKEPPQTDFIPNEKDPRFPGGPAALHAFLSRHLNTPGELEAGDKKMVHIRFKVDKDGMVNNFEIVHSGGVEFDREVMRVCRKMPRWEPAVQNGIHVPVSYLLPVTFIGIEQ